MGLGVPQTWKGGDLASGLKGTALLDGGQTGRVFLERDDPILQEIG